MVSCEDNITVFSAYRPATPGFGLTATSQPSTGLFATPTAGTPSFGNTSFGASTTPGFGAIGTSTATPAFGTTPAFGSTSSAPTFGKFVCSLVNYWLLCPSQMEP